MYVFYLICIYVYLYICWIHWMQHDNHDGKQQTLDGKHHKAARKTRDFTMERIGPWKIPLKTWDTTGNWFLILMRSSTGAFRGTLCSWSNQLLRTCGSMTQVPIELVGNCLEMWWCLPSFHTSRPGEHVSTYIVFSICILLYLQ